MNLARCVAFHRRLNPERSALVTPRGALSYKELDELIRMLARHLREKGLRKGQRVALYCHDDPRLHLALVCALNGMGIACLSGQRNDDPALLSRLALHAALVKGKSNVPFPFPVITFETGWMRAIRAEGGPCPDLEGFDDPEAACNIFLTSGTTGSPKAVAINSRQLEHRLSIRRVPASIYEGHADAAGLLWLDTAFGFETACSVLLNGGCNYLARSFDRFLEVIRTHGVTHLYGSVRQIAEFATFVKGRKGKCPSLKSVYTGGSHMGRELIELIRVHLCAKLYAGYGSTEVGNAAVAPFSLFLEQPRAVGYLEPWIQARVVDDSGAPLPPGKEGILQFRSPSMATEYVADPATSAMAFKDGWFQPNDIGRLGADGALILSGRVGDRVNIGGVKINPLDVEDKLGSHPGIREAVAFGVPGKTGMDHLVIAIVTTQDRDENVLRKHAGKLIELPHEVVFVKSIPRNVLGKVDRNRLRELLASR